MGWAGFWRRCSRHGLAPQPTEDPCPALPGISWPLALLASRASGLKLRLLDTTLSARVPYGGYPTTEPLLRANAAAGARPRGSGGRPGGMLTSATSCSGTRHAGDM